MGRTSEAVGKFHEPTSPITCFGCRSSRRRSSKSSESLTETHRRFPTRRATAGLCPDSRDGAVARAVTPRTRQTALTGPPSLPALPPTAYRTLRQLHDGAPGRSVVDVLVGRQAPPQAFDQPPVLEEIHAAVAARG